jgi:hypothetical protein
MVHKKIKISGKKYPYILEYQRPYDTEWIRGGRAFTTKLEARTFGTMRRKDGMFKKFRIVKVYPYV